MMKKVISLLLSTALCVSMFAGCGDNTGNTGSQAVPATSGSVSPESNVPVKHAPVDITVGTGGTAGTYYVVAAAMAQAVNDNSDFLNVTVQATKGSVENINLTNTGELEMGFSNADGVYWSTTGTGSYEGKEQNVSAMMSLYLSCGQMATLKSSGINSYADLKGKKVCLGPPSTTIVDMSKAILRAYGIDPEKDITPYYLAFDEGLSELTDGTIDATFFVAAAPTSAMVNACSGGNVMIIDVPEDILTPIAKENPYYSLYKIPAGTYNGNDKDVNTLKIMTEIFVNSDVEEDVVYEFVKQALENADSYVDAHVACKEIIPQTAASSISRMHPGALKYYTEVGAK